MRIFLSQALLALAFAAGIGAAQAQESGGQTPEAPAGAPVVAEMALGPETATVTVIEYASFVCPHCASFHRDVFPQIKADYIDTGKIRFIYRDVFTHRFGLWAAMTARCGGPERFFGIAGLLYQKQEEWIGTGEDPAAVSANLRTIGKTAGLTEGQLDACLNDQAMAEALVADFQKNMEEHSIDGTPTFVIDGEVYSNMPYEEFAALLDEKLGE